MNDNTQLRLEIEENDEKCSFSGRAASENTCEQQRVLVQTNNPTIRAFFEKEN